MITKYTNYCLICGKPKDDEHHMFSGSLRHLADADGLTIPLCREHHTMGKISAHKSKEMKVLINIIGQLAWEKDQVEQGMSSEMAREEFLRRYGRTYL